MIQGRSYISSLLTYHHPQKQNFKARKFQITRTLSSFLLPHPSFLIFFFSPLFGLKQSHSPQTQCALEKTCWRRVALCTIFWISNLIIKMERSTPVRKPHTSTADLLVWSETPPSDSPAQASATRSSARVQVKLIFFFIFLLFFFFFATSSAYFLRLSLTWCNYSRRMGSVRWFLGVRWRMRKLRA